MGIQKQNINKHIASQPKFKVEPSNGKKSEDGDMMSAIMPYAQKFVEKMDTKYKFMILGVVYLLFAGAWQTVIWIINLINLIF